ncbi:hypothetical protein DEO72_LG11g2340 [Vigna unguiculata]|uniref:Uncharacterized protein n=1 Tax=Vigna unguiculata TaxID=3917 RepID=A0A4D6NQY1_VIGUN|nr:hypothetical protein DEO72_LG11g2340 [Vigna unguiculata]
MTGKKVALKHKQREGNPKGLEELVRKNKVVLLLSRPMVNPIFRGTWDDLKPNQAKREGGQESFHSILYQVLGVILESIVCHPGVKGNKTLLQDARLRQPYPFEQRSPPSSSKKEMRT